MPIVRLQDVGMKSVASGMALAVLGFVCILACFSSFNYSLGCQLTVYADSPSQKDQQPQTEAHSIQLQSVKLFAWQGAGEKRKYTEFDELRETINFHVIPSAKFDVICNVIGEPSLKTGDFFLWTTVDFLVAPVTEEYAQKDTDQLAKEIGWGQVTEMLDFKAVPIYLLKPGESRRVVIRDFNLEKVLAAFPIGDAGNLWPWLIRLNIHIQDRSGESIAFSQKTLRLWPGLSRNPKS
jgi:hypothetical protein